MTKLDKMARELLAAEYERDRPGSEIAARLKGDFSGQLSTAATVAMAAIRAAMLTAPPGYVLVPVEPTPRMSAAGFCADEGHDPAGVYRAMIAAAPEPGK